MSTWGPTEGELQIMKRLDLIADILRFWVCSHAPGGYDTHWITKQQADYEAETFKLMKEAGMFNE